jgi:hypothetical protein
MQPAPIPWWVSVVQLGPAGPQGQPGSPLPAYGLSKDFGNWLQSSIVQNVASAPTTFPRSSLSNQSGGVAPTPIPLPSLAAGTYRISYYLRKTVPDGVSSSLTITFGWTEGTVALTLSGPPLTVDAITAVQTGTVLLLIDANSPITYAIAYASNTPGTMKYKLSVVVELVP